MADCKRKSDDNIRNEAARKLARLCKKETLFRLKGDRLGDWRTVKALYDPRVAAYLSEKYGDRVECVANVDIEKAVSFVGVVEADGTIGAAR